MSTFETIKNKIVEFVAGIVITPSPLFIMLKSHPYEVKGPTMRKILDSLQTGDILLRRYKYYVANWFIPGKFSHAALYVGDNSVIHMLGDGITKEDILTFMRCDDICILRLNNDDGVIKKAINSAFELLNAGVEYDFNFSTKNDKFYCTELIDKVYEGHINYSSKLSDKFISPDDMLTSNLTKIFPES